MISVPGCRKLGKPLLRKAVKQMNVRSVLLPIFAVVSISAFVPISAFAQIIATDGLVSYWSFDKTSVEGKVVKDVWGENHGNMVGDPQIAMGKVGDALEFDGEDDYVEVADDESLEGLPAMTISAWILKNEGHMTILGKRDSWGNGEDREYHLWTDPENTIRFRVFDEADKQVGFLTDPDVLRIGEWTHIAVAWDGLQTSEGLALYVNAVDTPFTPNDSGPFGNMSSGPSSLDIGRRGDEKIYFNGIMDEICIYNRALTEAEVKQNLGAKGLAVEPNMKLSLTWGQVRSQ